jgi:microcystin-dependent protein
MPYIIPNAIDTTSGNKYSALDQAEPDSIDFEVLGNSNTGVISGCEVTPTTVQGTAVAVAGGVVVVNGTVYSVEPNSYLALPAPPSTLRFDLVVARVSGSTASVVCLFGGESATNPAFPKSKSRIVSTAGLNVLSYFNPDTDVVLASIYRFASNSITSAEIVDKRKNIQTPSPFRGPVAPQPTIGSVGDFYLHTGSLGIGSSGVYVKRTSDQWVELANIQADPGVPVGTVITWLVAGVDPNPSVWVECNGDYKDPVVMPLLFNVLDYSFGQETGTTRFKLPNLQGMYLAGLPSTGGSLATQVGNDGSEVTLTENNLPRHRHTMDHGHSAVATDLQGRHRHLFTRNRFEYLNAVVGTGSDNVQRSITGTDATQYNTDGPSGDGNHQHSVTIPPSTGLSTGYAGQESPTPIDLRPQTIYVRYFIRYA